jgi:CheY-like chemotaxis protein
MESILIIDDDPATTRLLEVLLTREGYNILTENLSANAIQTTRKFSPNLIILDLMMPGTDGMEVCRMIKGDPELGDIPVLMFSAFNENELRKRAYEAGINEFISKPIHPNELKQIIRGWLDKTSLLED